MMLPDVCLSVSDSLSVFLHVHSSTPYLFDDFRHQPTPPTLFRHRGVVAGVRALQVLEKVRRVAGGPLQHLAAQLAHGRRPSRVEVFPHRAAAELDVGAAAGVERFVLGVFRFAYIFFVVVTEHLVIHVVRCLHDLAFYFKVFTDDRVPASPLFKQRIIIIIITTTTFIVLSS